MRMSIDAAMCTGHGRCYALSQSVVAPDDEGHGEVIAIEVAPEHHAAARRAEANCPERAIKLDER